MENKIEEVERRLNYIEKRISKINREREEAKEFKEMPFYKRLKKNFFKKKKIKMEYFD